MNFSTLRLRPYQVEAQQAIVEARKRGFRAQLVSLATGLGKTVVIATLPELLELRPTDVTLIVAHRDELISQLVEKMKAQNPDAIVGVEKAQETAAADCTIVVATVQTLTGPRLTRFLTRFGRRIALFVIDEAHHAAAPTYRAILDQLARKRRDVLVLGFTATPQRGDGVELNEIFPDTVYAMDARAAITAGYLVPVKSYAVTTDIDLDAVASRAGDFVLGQLADAVDTEERNRAVLDAYQTLVPGKKTLVFTASVEHARHLAELFKEAGIRAAFASGETPQAQREAIVAGFRGTTIDVLVNCGLYLEGFDVPSVEVIINARPTKSTTLYTQVTGRGLRPLEQDAFAVSLFPTPEARRGYIAQTGKPYATIIDIVDRARRHELVTLPTLWGMPAQIGAEGRLISQLADQYEELFRLAPRQAAKARTAEQIENALIEAQAERSHGRSAAWQMIGPEHWRLERSQRVARDRKGRPIPHFATRFDGFIETAKRVAPKENPEAFAIRTLDVDRRTVALQTQVVDVVRRGDVWVAMLGNGRTPARDLLSAPTLPDAIAATTVRLDASNGPGKRWPNVVVQAKRRNTRRWRTRRKRPDTSAEAV
ncbi:MAG: DEAD/DEAH box helicase family protein [Candidatus Eremiobacteraeota bacterium]|nr:DEAD/DEAH box helicase family protein [Candidatus Eremiobacteraeota bacterium]MBC5804481.1 DEAD/DEAH box helicase family protein [Candidatus Eremiobacteraeota bacterium]MBC5821238.1 DEAD/DEAH box helicase family protein [Candidatus Eremiobacteraeota bacterium]